MLDRTKSPTKRSLKAGELKLEGGRRGGKEFFSSSHWLKLHLEISGESICRFSFASPEPVIYSNGNARGFCKVFGFYKKCIYVICMWLSISFDYMYKYLFRTQIFWKITIHFQGLSLLTSIFP